MSSSKYWLSQPPQVEEQMERDAAKYAAMTTEQKIAHHREQARYLRSIGEAGFAAREDRIAIDLLIPVAYEPIHGDGSLDDES